MSGVTIFLSSLPFLNATYITSSSSSKLSNTISLLSFISHSILLFVKTVGIGVTVGAAVGVAVGLDVTVGIGTVVGVAVGFTVGVAVGLGVAVGIGTIVGVGTVVGVAVGVTVGVAVGLSVAVGVGTVVGVAVGVAVGLGVDVGIIALTALYAFNLPPLITLPVSAESLSELEHKVSLISFAEIFGFTARITATALATIGVAIEVPDIVP